MLNKKRGMFPRTMRLFLAAQLTVLLTLGAVPVALANQEADPAAVAVSSSDVTLPLNNPATDATPLDLGDPSAYVEGQILVTLADDVRADEKLDNLALALDEAAEGAVTTMDAADTPAATHTQVAEVIEGTQGQPVAVIDIPKTVTVADAITEALRDPAVVAAQPNYRYALLDDENEAASPYSPLATTIDDPDASLYQWWLNNVHAYDAWDLAKADNAVTVAVIDTGARLTHADLAPNIDAAHAWDTVSGSGAGQQLTSAVGSNGDVQGHGTHVSGIVAARANNGILGAGVSYNANILPVMVFYWVDDDPATPKYEAGWFSDTGELLQAYTYLIGLRQTNAVPNLRIVNMSLGGDYSAPTSSTDIAFHNAIIAAQDNGIVTVAAAGNGATATSNYPSDWSEVVSVTAVDSSNTIWSGSDHNAYKNICAPGVSVYSALFSNDTAFGSKTGTSMACPVVSGIAALIWAANPALTVAQVKTILYATATDLGTPGRDDYYGNGLVNANAAVAAALETFSVTYAPGLRGSFSAQVFSNLLTNSPTPSFTNTPSSDSVRWAFSGWSPAPTPLVTEDTTYTAQWQRVPLTTNSFSGTQRYETSRLINAKAMAYGLPINGAIIVTGEDGSFADALSASGLSGLLGYPLILTSSATLAPDAQTTLDDLTTRKGSALDILVIGGSSAIKPAVFEALKAYDPTPYRIEGADRYDTANKIYAYGESQGSWNKQYAIVATGSNFPDALSIASFATSTKTPLFLVNNSSTSLSPTVSSRISAFAQAIALGGEQTVSASVFQHLLTIKPAAQRIGGTDRYETSSLIVSWELARGMTLNNAGFADGSNFPDSLASSFLLAQTSSVLCLVSNSDPSDSNIALAQFLEPHANDIASIHIFGGNSSVSPATRDELIQALA